MEASEVFSVGHGTARRLARLVTSPDERAALDRLESFSGTAADMRTMDAMLRRAGESELADALIGAGDV